MWIYVALAGYNTGYLTKKLGAVDIVVDGVAKILVVQGSSRTLGVGVGVGVGVAGVGMGVSGLVEAEAEAELEGGTGNASGIRESMV